MSRSYKKTPIGGMTCSESDKADKVIAHRRTRAATRVAMARGDEPPDYRLTEDPWTYDKDGKQWFGDRHPKSLRK